MDFCGFLIMMEIPKDMKGLEKSITSSRTRVIVRGAIAISAFCRRTKAERQWEKFGSVGRVVDPVYNTTVTLNQKLACMILEVCYHLMQMSLTEIYLLFV